MISKEDLIEIPDDADYIIYLPGESGEEIEKVQKVIDECWKNRKHEVILTTVKPVVVKK